MSRFTFGMFMYRMQSKSLVTALLVQSLMACGPSAPDYHPAGSTPTPVAGTASPVVSESPQQPTARKETASAPPSETMTPTPAPPATPPAPPRTLPNATEKTAMTTLYAAANNQGGCAGCHGALNASAKKGRTAQQIASAQTIIQHRAVAAANKWPKDIPDTTHDGVDTAQLLLSAMVEILK